MIFSSFKYYTIYFHVNEHLAAPFVELAKAGFSVGYVCFLLFPTVTQA